MSTQYTVIPQRSNGADFVVAQDQSGDVAHHAIDVVQRADMIEAQVEIGDVDALLAGPRTRTSDECD